MATQKTWLRLAGLSGASAVGLGAYAAHGMKGADPNLVRAMDNGNKQHLAHTIALLAGAGAHKFLRYPTITLSLFTGGIVVFSGSCYAAAISGDRTNGRFAPYGGMALIAAWISMIP